MAPLSAALCVVLVVTSLPVWTGCSRNGADRDRGQSSSQPNNETAKNSSLDATKAQPPGVQLLAEAEADHEFLDRVNLAIVQQKLTKLPLERLSFELVAEAAPGARLVNVREKHDSHTGGDPATAPRLFSVRLDQTTDVLWTDALSPVGEFQALSKAKR